MLINCDQICDANGLGVRETPTINVNGKDGRHSSGTDHLTHVSAITISKSVVLFVSTYW